jgi:4-amino-4-deoxy-L-arabinose transferase
VIRRWAIIAALFLIPCGAIGVVETTEARYAEIAREMVTTHEFLIPHLDGLPHFDKPPGAYWAMAPSVALFGHNEWGARVSVVLAAMLTLFFTARIAAAAGADASLATWILAASPLFFILFHLASADPFLTAAVTGFHAAYLSRWRWLPFVALAMGLLIKGPVVFVATILPLFAAAWWSRSWGGLRALRSVGGWLLVLVFGLGWYLYIVVRVPGLASYLLGSELWQRFASTKHHRGGPPYYFVVLLVAGALPWTWAMIRGIASRLRIRADFEKSLIATWVLTPLVFFSFSGSKLPGYVLPLMPALAIAAAWPLASARWPRWTAPALVAVFGVVPWFFVGQDEMAGSVRPVARYLIRETGSRASVYECGPFIAGLPYYLGRTLPLVDVDRNMRFASTAEKEAVVRDGFGTAADSAFWVFGEQALAVRHSPPGATLNPRLGWRKYLLLQAFSEP